LRYQSWEDAVLWLISQEDRQGEVRANYFDQPTRVAAERYSKSAEWNAIRALLPAPPGVVVEVGAGNGIASFALARDGWQVIAIEPDSSKIVGRGAIRSLRVDMGLDIDVREGVGENLPVQDTVCDLVFAREVLHHARDLGRLCREACRVLKPGGWFLAAREHVLSSPRDLGRFLEAHPLHRLYGGENAFPLRSYQSALCAAGFRIERKIRPLSSVINFAPHDDSTLKQEFHRRLRLVPGGGMAARLLLSRPLYPTFLKLASLVDRRPGRLYSFVCRKPRG
jgi:SAM-dependent methyltransferase